MNKPRLSHTLQKNASKQKEVLGIFFFLVMSDIIRRTKNKKK